jgi:hypothetical protein
MLEWTLSKPLPRSPVGRSLNFEHTTEFKDTREENVLAELVQVAFVGLGVEAHAARLGACDTHHVSQPGTFARSRWAAFIVL